MPKQFLNNPKITVKKSRKLFDLKNRQNTDVNLAKSFDFWVNFRFTSTIFNLLVLKKIKSFPLTKGNVRITPWGGVFVKASLDF